MDTKSELFTKVEPHNESAVLASVRKYIRWRFPRMFILEDILQQLRYYSDSETLAKLSRALKEKPDVIELDGQFAVVNGWILFRIVTWVTLILMSFGALCSGNVKDQEVVLACLLMSVVFLITELV